MFQIKKGDMEMMLMIDIAIVGMAGWLGYRMVGALVDTLVSKG